MVTAERIWEALAQIPDPEIPVISLVDLGVVKDVAVEGKHVRIAFTPTFMGCPALDAMRRQMEEAVTAVGGEPEIDVLLDDSWSTDKITPPAARSCAKPALHRRHREARGHRHSSSSNGRSSAAPTAARRRRAWRTSSARRRAARFATATAAGSRSSSSRRSRAFLQRTSFNALQSTRPRAASAVRDAVMLTVPSVLHEATSMIAAKATQATR